MYIKFCDMQNIKAGYHIIISHDHYAIGRNKLLITFKVLKAAGSHCSSRKLETEDSCLTRDNLYRNTSQLRLNWVINSVLKVFEF